MKKMKKLFAMLLTLAMVFGMSMTSFAAPAATAKITVKNLTANDKTTLNLYQVVKFNDATSSWEVTDWVKNALKSDHSLVDLTTKPAKIDYAKLAEKYLPTSPNAVKENVNTTSCDFTDLEVGAYLITASGNTTSYTVMGTGTYDYDENSNLIKPVSKEISAKGETYTVVKTLKNSNQTFVNRTFTITDTPTGMKVTGVKVSVGGTELTKNVDYTISELGVKDKAVTVSFTSDYIGTSNAHAAAAVRVEVTAVVTSDDGTYSNKATSGYDSTPSEVVDTSGSITINKTDDNKTTPNPLTGAKFSIKKGETTLEFVELSAGEYTLYTPEGKQKVTDVTVNEKGVVTVKGLGAGEYVITETLAPEGYSVNNNIPNVTLEEGEHQNRTIQVKDSKLSALPSTGGIGTTIFTIAGCVIMIAAAGLFFASRKKSDNK